MIGDLTCFFTPMNYRQINDVNRVQYEDQKIMQTVNNTEMPEEEKISKLGEALRRITQLTIRSIAGSVSAIKTTDAMVTDLLQIEEFLLNAPKSVFETVKDRVIALREATDLSPISMTCESCQNQYEQPFTLDMSNFFEIAS
jgi:hypothetical protein